MRTTCTRLGECNKVPRTRTHTHTRRSGERYYIQRLLPLLSNPANSSESSDALEQRGPGSRLSLVPYSGTLQVRGSDQLPYHRHPTSVFVSAGLVGASGAPC